MNANSSPASMCSPMFGRRFVWRRFVCRAVLPCDAINVWGWPMPLNACEGEAIEIFPRVCRMPSWEPEASHTPERCATLTTRFRSVFLR